MSRYRRRQPRRTSTAGGCAAIIFAVCLIVFGLFLFWLFFGQGYFLFLVLVGVLRWFMKLNPPSRNARE